MLKDEKSIVEEGLEKSQNSCDNLHTQSQGQINEIKIYQDENVILCKEFYDLKSSWEIIRSETHGLEIKLENLSKIFLNLINAKKA